MCSGGYCSCPVSLSLCVCVCASVKSHLTSGASVSPENSVTYSTGNEGQNLWRFLWNGSVAEIHHFLRVGYCSDIPHTFLTAEPSKDPKKANHTLNTTWNTTRCSFFLFSLCLLPSLLYTFWSSSCAFNDSRTRVRRGFCTLVHSLIF